MSLLQHGAPRLVAGIAHCLPYSAENYAALHSLCEPESRVPRLEALDAAVIGNDEVQEIRRMIWQPWLWVNLPTDSEAAATPIEAIGAKSGALLNIISETIGTEEALATELQRIKSHSFLRSYRHISTAGVHVDGRPFWDYYTDYVAETGEALATSPLAWVHYDSNDKDELPWSRLKPMGLITKDGSGHEK
jgi:hypothetical protein